MDGMTKKAWLRSISDLGCIVCLNEYGIKSDPDIHHILKSGRKIDDLHTIPLCPTHHRLGVNNDQAVSRHPWRREFELRYGTEMELLANTKNLIA
jgi:hypothetical protein